MNPEHPFLAQLAQHGLWAPPARTNGHPLPGPPARPEDPGGPRYGHAALLGECADVAAAHEGSRNHRLNLAAFKLGQLCALGWITDSDASTALRVAALATGLLPGEIEATITSGMRAGHAVPRDVVLRALQADTTLDPAATVADAVAGDPAGEPGQDPDELRAAAAAEYHRRCVEEEVRRLRVRHDAKRLYEASVRPAHTVPEILTVAELLSRPRQPVRWRIPDWQPLGGRVLLAAQYKAGKTTLVGNLLRCLADGAPWLGRHPVDPVDGVALLDLEMGERQLGDWLRDQHIEHPERIIVVPLRGKAGHLDLLDPEVRSQWAAQLRAAGVQYLVLDCLRPLLDVLGLDEHRDAGQLLVAFDALLVEAGISDSLIVHHMGHDSERSRGDSRIRDWPDVEWRIVRQDDDPASPRFVSAFGRDVDITETQLHHDPRTRHLTLAGGSRRDARAKSALFDVLAALTAAGQPLSGRQLLSELADSEHGRDVVRDALKLGVRLGSVTTEIGPRRAIMYSILPSA